jgi:putative ABC transport system permease protein
MGLFGLASYTAEQRTREIGIRKVLGADTMNIITILSREFSICIIWANIIAWPVAYFALDKWLTNFVYRVNVSLYVMIASGLIAFILSFLTVVSQAVRAASVNPVVSLKYE